MFEYVHVQLFGNNAMMQCKDIKVHSICIIVSNRCSKRRHFVPLFFFYAQKVLREKSKHTLIAATPNLTVGTQEQL